MLNDDGRMTALGSTIVLNNGLNMNHNRKGDTEVCSVLFICLGNICRSPAADAVFGRMVDEAGLADRFVIDSAGIGPWHVGELADRRMREHAQRRGYNLTHVARQFDATADFRNFSLIVVMDDENYRMITSKARDEADKRKVIRMSNYFETHKNAASIPDPYYGGASDFELALDLIEDGCRGLLGSLSKL